MASESPQPQPGGAIAAFHPASQFASHRQQFEAAKLGMWLFLASEIVFFGGLFCLYAVFRNNYPDVFRYGSQFLDVRWGLINTVILITSSMFMAVAVWCAKCNHPRHLTFFLLLTLLLAGNFLVVKGLEYKHKFEEHLVWGMAFYEPPPGRTAPPADSSDAASLSDDAGEPKAAVEPVDIGKQLWTRTCAACHGQNGRTMAHEGVDFHNDPFLTEQTDQQLIAFIKEGRSPADPQNKTGRQMPPKGGNLMLSDKDLTKIVEYLRSFSVSSAENLDEEESSPIRGTTAPPSAAGPAGLKPEFINVSLRDHAMPEPTPSDVHHAFDPNRPDNAHLFFGLYFLMTGLHGVHVLAGMGFMAYLLFRSWRGHSAYPYSTSVEMGGLYWHVVDLIWIMLFPLLYLVH